MEGSGFGRGRFGAINPSVSNPANHDGSVGYNL